MIIVGLTGSMGMGKSTVAERFRQHDIAVFDADAEVHALYAGPLADAIEAAFPGVASAGQVDRAKLSAALVTDPHRFADLEAIVHPAVRQAEHAFLASQATRGARLAVLEIPLLLESANSTPVDVVVVASARPDVQRDRLLRRPGMTENKLDTLLARQMADSEKRRRADVVIDTNGTVAACHAQVDDLVNRLAGMVGTAYQKSWKSSPTTAADRD